MANHKIYLVTGANRGIGKALVERLLQRPGLTIIAAARDEKKATAALSDLPKAEGTSLIVVTIDSTVDTDPADAVARLKQDHQITSVDVVIANAGISHSNGPVIQTSAEALRDHFNVNSIAPVMLFQAVYPLLKASTTGNPIFLPISTALGSIGLQPSLSAFPPVLSPYGVSKTALNWLVVRMHLEEPWLTTWVTHPGLVLTDMSAQFKSTGIDPASLGAITVETSVAGLLQELDKANRDEFGGTFRTYDGSALPW